MPNALFDAIQRIGTPPPTEKPLDFSSLRPGREACKEAFLSQREAPYSFLCGQTPVRLFFDADGAPLDALILSYVGTVFQDASLPDPPAQDAGAPCP